MSPTNVSTPDWACDLCRTRFGDNRDAAARCESGGPPAVLPAGELLLSHRSETYGHPQGFYLQSLYPIPGAVDTIATTHGDQVGHFTKYWLDVDPNDYWTDGYHGRFIRRPEPNPREVESRWLWPHASGVLNVIPEHWISSRNGSSGRDPAGWMLERVGLADPDWPEGAELAHHFARPLTPAVAAVLDALGAQPEPVRHDQYRGWKWSHGTPLGALAVETAGGNLHRARWWLRCVAAQPLADQVNERWRRWRAGGPGDVPLPRLRCHRQLSASKLTKDLRALVAATGVDWPARRSSDDYVRSLITKTLEYTMETTEMLFAGPDVVAVGGTKGGVGKSTVAAALARRLAVDGRRVVLVDLDLTGPSQHLLFPAGHVVTDVATRRLRPSPTGVEGLGVFSPGQLFGPDAKTRWDETTIRQWLTFVGSCLDLDGVDVVVLDLPPGANTVHDVVFDDRQVKMATSVHVTTAHPLALADTERGLAAADGVRSRYHARWHRHHLVENLSRATGTTRAGETVEIRLAGDVRDVEALAERYGLGWGGSLPWAPNAADLAASDELGRLAGAVLAGEPAVVGAA